MPTTESSASTQGQIDVPSAKAELVDPRTISKQTDSVGRSQVASEVLAARANIRTLGKEIQDKTTRAAEINDKLPDVIKEESKVRAEIRTRDRNLLVRLKGLLGIRDKTVSQLEEKNLYCLNKVKRFTGNKELLLILSLLLKNKKVKYLIPEKQLKNIRRRHF